MIEGIAFRQVGIIGTGRVARALGRLLVPHSAAPILVWGRNALHCSAALEEIPEAKAATEVGKLTEACDLVAIAVADDALPKVIAQLDPVMNAALSPFIFHVSGRSGSAVLEALESHGAMTAAIHPVMTFTGDVNSDVQKVHGAWFAITASQPSAAAKARALVRLLGGRSVEVAEKDRVLYHAALSHAANHLVTLIAQSSRMLQEANVREPRAVFAPLIRASLENSLQRGFAALSGPLLRDDQETIDGHLAALQETCPDIVATYRVLALATLDELERAGKSVSPELRRKLNSLAEARFQPACEKE